MASSTVSTPTSPASSARWRSACPLRGAKVLVLGAGGAARAAVFGLRDSGAEVFILNRTAETAQKLARQSGSKTISKEALAKTSFDVIINATPVGMAGNKAPQILEAKDLNTRLVFDLVYNPLETPLIHMARQKSIPIITGVEMFVQQGARQFEIFTGKPAPEEEMFRVVLHALRQQRPKPPPQKPPKLPHPRPQKPRPRNQPPPNRPLPSLPCKPAASKPAAKPAAQARSQTRHCEARRQASGRQENRQARAAKRKK